jgi:hypothetical protein
MLIQRAETQFDHTIAQSLAADPAGKHIVRVAHAAVHETVVSLIKLFRDQIPGAAGVPTLDCLRAIAQVTRQARERYLPAPLALDDARH